MRIDVFEHDSLLVEHLDSLERRRHQICREVLEDNKVLENVFEYADARVWILSEELEDQVYHTRVVSFYRDMQGRFVLTIFVKKLLQENWVFFLITLQNEQQLIIILSYQSTFGEQGVLTQNEIVPF